MIRKHVAFCPCEEFERHHEAVTFMRSALTVTLRRPAAPRSVSAAVQLVVIQKLSVLKTQREARAAVRSQQQPARHKHSVCSETKCFYRELFPTRPQNKQNHRKRLRCSLKELDENLKESESVKV